MADVNAFFEANPADDQLWTREGASALSDDVAARLGVPSPPVLREFWSAAGSGFFGDRRLWFFGSKASAPGRTLTEWNLEPVWRGVYPAPVNGGPVFFAETAFGGQLGFRWAGADPLPILFIPDTFDAFVLAPSLEALFRDVLSDPFAVIDPGRWIGVRERLGPLAAHEHYVPIVSPLVGGSSDPANFMKMSAVAHIRTAIAEYSAINS
jgi:hypothetical protein